MVFNLGIGEVVVLALLVVILLGPRTLPEISQYLLGDRSFERDPRSVERPPWSRSDWLSFGACALLVTVAIAIATVRG